MSTDAIPVVEARGLSKIYNNAPRPVLENVSLSVSAVERVAIVGASGSGKTTLLNLLGGLDRPTSGSVLFDGREPRGAAAWAYIRARRLGIVFQNFCLLPTLTAAENVELPMLGVEAAPERRKARAQALLERVGLADLARSLPAELSAGERQRVSIARSLANRPAVLLADEPTGNLDRATADQVVDLLVEMQAVHKLALVVVTHDPIIAGRCQRQLTLADGRVYDASTMTPPAAVPGSGG